MAEPYQLPSVMVVAASSSGGIVTTTIDVVRHSYYFAYPIAPASLWKIDADEKAFDLHQLIRREGDRLEFETYSTDDALPQPRSTLRYCSWWTPAAMDAVRDNTATWERLTYPYEDAHHHCLLTWETISCRDAAHEGYYSFHGWVTVGAYERFIAQDQLRIRTNWKSIE